MAKDCFKSLVTEASARMCLIFIVTNNETYTCSALPIENQISLCSPKIDQLVLALSVGRRTAR